MIIIGFPGGRWQFYILDQTKDKYKLKHLQAGIKSYGFNVWQIAIESLSLYNHIAIVFLLSYKNFHGISHSQELNVNQQQMQQIKRFWYHLKEEIRIFQTKQKLVELDQKKERHNEIEFVIKFEFDCDRCSYLYDRK